eukprot:31419-Pelagococcus_subviridis.AAC.14
MRRAKSLRNGVHHAITVVWEPVYRTHLIDAIPPLRRVAAAGDRTADVVASTPSTSSSSSRTPARVKSISAGGVVLVVVVVRPRRADAGALYLPSPRFPVVPGGGARARPS